MNAKQAKIIAELEEVRAANAEGNLVTDEAIEYARTHESSELHSRVTWDDTEAAVQWRRREMAHIIRAIYIEFNSDSKPVHAYWSPPSYRNGEDGYVHISKMRSNAEIAMEIARDMLTRVQAAHEDLLVAIEALPKLGPAAQALGRAVRSLERVIDDEGKPTPRRPTRKQVAAKKKAASVTGPQRSRTDLSAA